MLFLPALKHSFIYLLYYNANVMSFLTTLLPVVLITLQGSVNFKFGVLFARDGQLTDDEMFSNGKHL